MIAVHITCAWRVILSEAKNLMLGNMRLLVVILSEAKDLMLGTMRLILVILSAAKNP
ncbi:MAG TPA: hypothetical protein VEQ11_11090 [Chloroflexota bacterium]|nr:hypothetical protein [Chloroflexota bacterium]